MTNHIFPEKFFIAGTDTGVGKSIISAILAVGLNAKYWKPIQSGLQDETDTEFVRRRSGLGDEFFFDESFRLQNPLSPHASALIDGVSIQLKNFTLPDCSGPLIVEGAGGVMVPLNEHDLLIDLIVNLSLPVVLVARSSLGTINHTLLTLQALRAKKVEIIGVVINGEKNEINRAAIEYYGDVPVLAEIGLLSELSSKVLKNIFCTNF